MPFIHRLYENNECKNDKIWLLYFDEYMCDIDSYNCIESICDKCEIWYILINFYGNKWEYYYDFDIFIYFWWLF